MIANLSPFYLAALPTRFFWGHAILQMEPFIKEILVFIPNLCGNLAYWTAGLAQKCICPLHPLPCLDLLKIHARIFLNQAA